MIVINEGMADEKQVDGDHFYAKDGVYYVNKNKERVFSAPLDRVISIEKKAD